MSLTVGSSQSVSEKKSIFFTQGLMLCHIIGSLKRDLRVQVSMILLIGLSESRKDFNGIINIDPSVSKTNWLHVDIFLSFYLLNGGVLYKFL